VSSCIATMLSHASVRSYRGEPVREEDLKAIIEAARRAPSSWGLQPVTVTVVRSSELKRRIAEAVGGQDHVACAPVFLAFSIDYRMLLEAARLAGVEPSQPGPGHLAVGILDVGIAAGWAAVAAESLGYGTVFIALYSNPCRVAELLKLPPLVLPLVGLCIGWPAERPQPRPRQPPSLFYADEGYVSLNPSPLRALALLHGERAVALYQHVLGEGGYYDAVGRRLLDCARRRGFRV